MILKNSTLVADGSRGFRGQVIHIWNNVLTEDEKRRTAHNYLGSSQYMTKEKAVELIDKAIKHWDSGDDAEYFSFLADEIEDSTAIFWYEGEAFRAAVDYFESDPEGIDFEFDY